MLQPRDRYSPVFSVARAAELAGMHPQTLRQYDRIGLVCPRRTTGNTRRYSLYDIEQLREVSRLSSEGLSLEGIARVLQLENQVRALQGRVRELEQALKEQMLRSNTRVFSAGSAGEVVTLRAQNDETTTEIVVWRG